MRCSLIQLCTCLALLRLFDTAPVRADPVDPVQSADVLGLVKLLGADDFEVRDNAQKKLEALGRSAIEPLETAIRSSADSEVQARARRILEVIRKRLAKDELWSGTMITLEKKAKASEVIADLMRISGNEIKLGRHFGDVEVDVSFRDETFWGAVQEVCVQSHNQLNAQSQTTADAIVLESGNWDCDHIAISGSALARLTNISAVRQKLPVIGGGKVPRVELSFDVFFEPKIKARAYRSPGTIVHGPHGSEPMLEGALEPAENWTRAVEVHCFSDLKSGFLTPQVQDGVLSRVKIRVPLQVFPDKTTLTCDDPKDRKAYSMGGYKLVVDRCTVSRGGDGKLSILVVTPDGDEDVHGLQCRLKDDRGESIEIDKIEVLGYGAANEIDVAFHASEQQGAPKLADVIVNGGMSSKDVEFEFRKVALPAD